MKRTVFISSTFHDLKEVRARVWNSLEQFDVLIKGMERFGARKDNPLTTCLSEVEKSDIFVGIVGFRYGSIDPNTKKSFSHLEYEKAIETDCNILIYIADDEKFKITSNLIQYDTKEKLDTFKEILRNRHTVDTFADEVDLIDKLNRRFRELLTPKSDTSIVDEYDNTKKLLELFFLMPGEYSGREIKLKIIFKDTPQPASKGLCRNYNLEFGKTVIDKISVILPKFDFENFSNIIIEQDLIHQYLSLEKNKEYEIYANVMFNDEKTKSLTTNFKDRFEYHIRYDEYAELAEPIFPTGPFYEVFKPGEGQVALKLREIILK